MLLFVAGHEYKFTATIGPLHDPVTWYGINYTGTQITQWDFQNKGKSGWTGAGLLFHVRFYAHSLAQYLIAKQYNDVQTIRIKNMNEKTG